MAQDTLQRWPAGSMAKGVDVNRSDLSPTFQLLPDSYNLTMGINEGLGPRYGTAPLAGQSDTEAVGANELPGFMKYESGLTFPGSTLDGVRVGLFGIQTLNMRGAGGAGIGTTGKFYLGLISYTTSLASGTYLDSLLFATLSSTKVTQSQNFYSGQQYVGLSSWFGAVANNLVPLMAEKIPADNAPDISIANGAQREKIRLLTKRNITKPYISATPFSVLGGNIPMKWMVGKKITAPDATHAPALNLSYYGSTFGGGLGTGLTLGYPASFIYQNFQKIPTVLTFYTIAALDTGGITYTATLTPSAGIPYVPIYTDDVTSVFVQQVTATKTGGVAYAAVEAALMNDENMQMSSAYQGVLMADNKAVCVLYQDWYRSSYGEMQQYFDLTSQQLPTPSVSMSLAAGAANTGILRAGNTYEFGVSQFDKRLNFETNVVKLNGTLAISPATDFVSAIIFNGGGAGPGATIAVTTLGGATYPLKMPGIGGNAYLSPPQHINYLEYRFYYRQSGTAEWLPALFIDAAKYWFYPNFTAGDPLAMCTGGIGGLPGGYVGGFSDYSPLPPDTYNCVVIYKNRAFWLSEKNLIFSLSNNLFCYPGRNSAACPIGAFKGAIVHAYPGQAQQDSRLVVFSTNGTYVGRFTGALNTVPVQVSADTVASFGLDGSDFELDSWTSNSAFSYRSAVVADGILYFWGPKGIFRDDGVAIPARVSKQWEPDIFTYYDPARTDEIHTIYNDTTKEIYWFFPPKVADGYPTHALVLSTETMEFVPAKFDFQIDASNAVDVASDMGTAGNRSVLFTRATAAATIQRPFYFDHRNRSGDQYPTGELLVKQVSTPSAGIRRLTLAAGYDPTNFATIAAGDYICIQQAKDYAGAGLTTPSEMIAIIGAVGAGTIDIILPDDTILGDAVLTHPQYFPIWHRTPTAMGINGFPWNLTSKYWVPNGPNYWAYWLYLYFQFKLRLLASSFEQKIQLQYRTPVSAGFLTADDLTLEDNSDGNWQLYHPLTVGDQNMEGQGLKLVLSGIHIGSEWVLQYLEGHATQLEGEQLKIFEG